MARVDILLATYNGERFLAEQLASLTAQSWRDWRLIVRDDGSSDDTLGILHRWKERTGASVLLIEDGEKGCGACGNFARLLAASDSPFFAFCDQDDVWKPEKLEALMSALVVAEEEHGRDEPVLAFCDLVPVAQDLAPIAHSFRHFVGLAVPDREAVARHLLLQNFVTGCAMMGNAALRQAALPVPPEAVMHDWWLAMVAANMGRIVEVPEGLVLYRQHGGNMVGMRPSTLTDHAARLLRDPMRNIRHARAWVSGASRQAAAFAASYEGRMPPEAHRLYREFGEAPGQGFVRRKLFPVRHRARSNSTARIAAASLFL